MPRGVAMYLFAVTRLTVLSCISTASRCRAGSAGADAPTPRRKKPSCWRTISAATFRIVWARCCSDFTSQLAVCSFSVRNSLVLPVDARQHARGEVLADQHARHGLGVQLEQPDTVGAARISTSGTSGCGGVASHSGAGLGVEPRSSATISTMSCGIDLAQRHQPPQCRAAPAGRGCRAASAIAGSSRFRSASCTARHSRRSTANMPTGSNRIISCAHPPRRARASAPSPVGQSPAGAAESRPDGSQQRQQVGAIIRSTGS